MPRFVPRIRKHKNKREGAPSNSDSNVVEIAPANEAGKDDTKKSTRDQLRPKQPSISSKKRKRLDKYIVRILVLGSSIQAFLIICRKTN